MVVFYKSEQKIAFTDKIEYELNSIVDVKKGDIDIFEFSPATLKKIQEKFRCDDETIFFAIQTPEMRTSNMAGVDWRKSLISQTADKNKRVIAKATKHNFLNLFQQGMSRVYDDLMLSTATAGSFAIYAKREGYSQLAGVISGTKRADTDKTDFAFAVNPNWELGREIRPAQQERI